MATPLKRAKDKAWSAFSKYIRLRDCIATTGDTEGGICVTCKDFTLFKKAQAGHFISGRNNAVLFDEELVYLQCQKCNVFLGGNYVLYAIEMTKRYGLDKVEEFQSRKSLTVIYKLFDYERIKKEYEDKYEALLASQ